MIAPFAVASLFASEPAKDPRWNDAEQRYKLKYGRNYPSTERQQLEAAERKKKQMDASSTAQDNKKEQKQESERSRSRNGA